MQAHCIELMRHRENNVVMFHRKGVLHQVINPEGLFCSLAFGTVSVATAVVTVAYRATT